MTNVFNLTWLIPIPPLLAFFVIILFTNPHKRLSSNLAIGAVALSWVLSWLVALAYFGNWHVLVEEPFALSLPWLPTGNTVFRMGVAVDAVTAVMLFMVGFVLTMIFIYSHGYMTFPGYLDPALNTDGLDPRYSRFFAYISLFATGMLGLVVADNLLMLFVFWEIMGLCSYLLIGFWFDKTYPDPDQITPKQAGLKAFLTTRIGDVLLMIGLLLLFIMTGELNFQAIFQPEVLAHLAESHLAIPFLGAFSAAVVIAIFIFWGAIGKSAQFPLHVWLPDAMEGPTPVSALIHAATMVSAGVYLIIRMQPLFAAAHHGENGAMLFVAFIGAFTALFAATIALAQNDIKKVLAYSTVSQLGYMFAALGIGAWVAATFHLIMHAFFKALLFLGSGSVIHGVEHGHHHGHHGHHEHGHGAHDDHHEAYFDPQDMRNMGGLLRRMPATGWTFIIGAAALSGFPLVTAGFWSKDEILADAWYTGHRLVFWTLAAAALLTAFYSFRQVFMTFFGRPRTEAAAHAVESTRSMTVPLMVLAVFAIAAGWVGIPEWFPGVGALLGNPLGTMLGAQAEAYHLHHKPLPPQSVPFLVSVVVSLGGIFLAWLVYGRKPLAAGQPDPLERWLGPLYTVLRHKYYFDELYGSLPNVRPALVVRFVLWLMAVLRAFDARVIDGIVNGIGYGGRRLARGLRLFFDELFVDGAVNGTGFVAQVAGSVLRLVQNGQVQFYLLIVLLGTLAFLAFVQLGF
jgi:NADH-quinone oxidoreductase subunit L